MEASAPGLTTCPSGVDGPDEITGGGMPFAERRRDGLDS
jgi:hypothetical protein